MTEIHSFDPSRHLSLVNGNEYLEVKWRLVWFRSDYPEGRIETTIVHYGNGEAVVKAEVTAIREGQAVGFASDYGSEDAQGFGDYLEKASTKAIGRALAALGYGTQFTRDFDYGAEQGRVVDAPVRSGPQSYNGGGNRPSGSPTMSATEKQQSLIQSLGRDARLDLNALNELAEEITGSPLDALSRKDASALIDNLQERRKQRGN